MYEYCFSNLGTIYAKGLFIRVHLGPMFSRDKDLFLMALERLN